MQNQGIRVYADSSVFGGLFDPEFASESLVFFDQVRAGRFVLLSSVLVANELGRAPAPVRHLFDALLPETELVQVGLAASTLQSAYLAAGILTPKWADDALHVALATVGKADLIVSWNFRHIVHFQKVPRYNSVNRQLGYRDIAIHSPKEVIAYEEDF